MRNSFGQVILLLVTIFAVIVPGTIFAVPVLTADPSPTKVNTVGAPIDGVFSPSYIKANNSVNDTFVQAVQSGQADYSAYTSTQYRTGAQTVSLNLCGSNCTPVTTSYKNNNGTYNKIITYFPAQKTQGGRGTNFEDSECGGSLSCSSGDDSGGDSYSCPSGMTLYNNQCYSNELCTTTGSGKGARTSCAFDSLLVTNSCTLDGVTVPPNESRTFFSQTSVAYGEVCASVGQSRMCTNGTLSGSSVYNHANCAVGIAPPLGTISLDANPHIIRYGGTSRITWDGGNADTCTVSGTNFSASGVNGSKDATNITEETVYTLTCIKGPYQKSVSTTVRIVPLWQEI